MSKENNAGQRSYPAPALGAGTPAPGITLPSSPDQKLSPEDSRGRPVILAFYPADWSPVCGDEMALYNEILPEFRRFGAGLLGVSLDGPWCRRAFSHNRNLQFPPLSDFEPEGEASRLYGVYRRGRRHERAGAFRHRRRGADRLELRLAYRCESGGGRHTPRAGKSAGEGGMRMAGRMTATLNRPVGRRDHAQGSPDASVTLVEYGDFECGYCGEAYAIVKQVQKVMGERLRFVFRHFPLTQIHPHAERAAESSEAAAAQGRFWEMHDLLYENQQTLDDWHLVRLAETLEVDAVRLARELQEGTYRERVREDFMGGVRSGVNGTPTFFINGVRHDGPWDAESLLASIERAG